MCGIGGFYNVSTGSVPVKSLKSLWKALEVRGTHASGFGVGWYDTDVPITVKKAGPTHHLTKQLEKFVSGSYVQYVLLHTRHATQGNVTQNGNNHPIQEHEFTTTHNGWINNYSEIINELRDEPPFHLTPNNEVDSECLNMILKAYTPEVMASWVDGPVSLAWVDHTQPELVHLFTNGLNPLVIGRTVDGGNIVWASTERILEQSDFDIAEYFHATPFKQYTLSPDGKISSLRIAPTHRTPHWGHYRAARSTWEWDNVPNLIQEPQTRSNTSKQAVYSQQRGWVWE